MDKGRLEAFSDGVIAVIITIMVLELKPPHGVNFQALQGVLPTFLVYVLSFMYVGIYWNNHHHLLKAVQRVDGLALWANLHLLFWLSLVPFTTSWVSEDHYAAIPTALYGFVLLMAAIAYSGLVAALVRIDGNSDLAVAIGNDFKGKFSIVCYVAAIVLAFLNVWIADAVVVIVALVWFIPDSRIEKRLGREEPVDTSASST